jgi:hypothetical protein
LKKILLSKNGIKIIEAISFLSKKRELNKNININAYTISKLTGISWETVKNNLKTNLKLKELK